MLGLGCNDEQVGGGPCHLGAHTLVRRQSLKRISLKNRLDTFLEEAEDTALKTCSTELGFPGTRGKSTC